MVRDEGVGIGRRAAPSSKRLHKFSGAVVSSQGQEEEKLQENAFVSVLAFDTKTLSAPFANSHQEMEKEDEK